ncbi:hypothetical protein MRX96_046947 [Rhipicephalus microplus]
MQAARRGAHPCIQARVSRRRPELRRRAKKPPPPAPAPVFFPCALRTCAFQASKKRKEKNRDLREATRGHAGVVMVLFTCGGCVTEALPLRRCRNDPADVLDNVRDRDETRRTPGASEGARWERSGKMEGRRGRWECRARFKGVGALLKSGLLCRARAFGSNKCTF